MRFEKVALPDPVRDAKIKRFWQGMDRVRDWTMWAPSQVAAMPVRGAQEMMAWMLLGPKARSGPFKGKRMHKVEGPVHKRHKAISKAMFKRMQRGEVPGTAISGNIGGKDVFYKRRMSPKGLVGLMRKYPLHTAGLGGLGYLMMKAPAVRPSMPQMNLTIDARKALQPRENFQNPLANQVWG